MSCWNLCQGISAIFAHRLLFDEVLILELKANFKVIFINHQSNFWPGFIPVNGGGWIYPTLKAISVTLSPSRSIQGILLLQTNTLVLLLTLCLSPLLWSSSLPLALHFKLQCFSQNMPIIPPQHMSIPSHSIRLSHLNHWFIQSQHLH